MRVYFAHSMRDYRTERERRALDCIRSRKRWKGATVTNPAELDWQDLVIQEGSHDAVYDLMIGNADEVAVLEHASHVGRGAFGEVTRALAAIKPVWALRRSGGGAPVWVRVHRVEIADRSDWKVRYGRLVVANRSEP